MQTQEIWAKCQLLPDNYEVSNLGKIRLLYRGELRIKYTHKSHDGYLEFKVSINGKPKYYKVSRIVAITFIPNPMNLPEVNHIDYNKLNNSVCNLEWITGEDNLKHGFKRRQRKVYQYLPNGELVYIHESQQEAHQKLGYGRVACIHQCIKGKIKSAYGYIWSEKELINDFFNNFNGRLNKGEIKVAQYTLSGMLIRTYDKIADAKIIGFNAASISKCINGKQKEHKNFIWRRL